MSHRTRARRTASKRAAFNRRLRAAPPPPAPASAPPPAPARLLSLDAFRGLTIFGMLLVNNVALSEATPGQWQHARWNEGVTFADFVFPWFLLIVGVAVPYAWASHRKKGFGYGRWLAKALGRALVLLALGCLILSSLAHQPVFALGVLQLIGLAYCVGALCYPLPLAARLALAAALLLGHWALLRFAPLPGVDVFSEEQNVIAHLNRTYLARYHLNGLVSVIPTGAMVLLGTAFGDVLRSAQNPRRKLSALLVGGLALAAVGWLWSYDLPFNKPVWTASYILYTAGWGAVTLGALFALIDMARFHALAFPFIVFGANAILAYVAPILVKVFILQGWTWPMPDGTNPTLQTALLQAARAHFGPFNGGLAYTFGYIAVWWLVLLVLYRKGIFLRV